MSVLGFARLQIQKGVGSGNITINEIDPAKSIIFCSSFGGATQINGYIVNATTINMSASGYWTVVEFGGAI